MTLQIEDVPLETAVRLLAEMAGLKPVRMGNVLFVTAKATATELRADPEMTQPTPPIGVPVPFGNGVIGGFGGAIGGGIATPVPPPGPPAIAPAVPPPAEGVKPVDKPVEKALPPEPPLPPGGTPGSPRTPPAPR